MTDRATPTAYSRRPMNDHIRTAVGPRVRARSQHAPLGAEGPPSGPPSDRADTSAASRPRGLATAVERWLDLPGRGRVWVRDCAGPSPNAPTALLLHGLGATARLTWGESYDVLAEHMRVIAVDHRGHGNGLRTRRFRLEDCADDAIAAATALGASRSVLVGYSLGGPIALLGWQRHRERVAGLVLAATAAHFGGTRRTQVARLLAPMASLLARLRPEQTRRMIVERALFRVDRPDMAPWIEREIAGHHPPTLIQAARAAWAFSFGDQLAGIDVPVSVVITAEDDRIGVARQRELAAAIPGARQWEVPGPHTACLTRADRFAPALAEACLDAWTRSVHAGRLDGE